MRINSAEKPLRESLCELSRVAATFTAFAILVAACGITQAQMAVLEIAHVFDGGEGIPVYAAKSDDLILHRSPNLKAERFVVSYGEGRRIPFSRDKGMTRVLILGRVEVLGSTADDACTWQEGTVVEYLYPYSEGFAALRGDGEECAADIADPEMYRVISEPGLQFWTELTSDDGKALGWLFLDGTQTDIMDWVF
ncbi:MAG: hypothetical protein AAGL69_07270 [Pseudomonadota bacterium]